MYNAKISKKMIIELDKLGIKKDQIDKYMVWGIYKLMLGVMKIKWSLEENGIKNGEAEKTLNKIVDSIVKIDADDLHKMIHKSKDWQC